MATQRQKLAVQELVENGGNISMGEAMRNAGYSTAMVNNPQRLTHSKGWIELIEEFIPEEKILKKLGENIESNSIHGSNAAIDIALRIRGKYAPDKFQLLDPIEELTDFELDKEIERLEQPVKKRMKLNETNK